VTVPSGKFRSNEEQLRELLTRQLGLVTTEQAALIGFTPSVLSKRMRAGELERVLPGVYRSALITSSRMQSLLAALLWAGRDAVASHGSAALLWSIDGVPCTQPEIWLPRDRGHRSEKVVIHRGVVPPVDRRLRHNVPVTSAARTLIDLAAQLDQEMLEAAVEDVLHRGLTTAAMLERRLDALGGKGRSGSGALRQILASRGSAALESRLEVKVWNLVRRLEPRPVRQFDVRVGTRKYRLDFAWPALKVAVEADGYATHGSRRSFVADRRRLADLVSAGWTVLPVTWEACIQDPDGFLRRIGAVLIRAA
jgi:very-short-patch-repair endonuclease